MRTKNAGFTLLELVIVMTITSLVVAIATVRMTGMLGAASQTDTLERLIELDRQTRRHAVIQGRRCTMQFNVPENGVRVTRWQQGQEFSRSISFHPNAEIVEVGPNAGSISIQASGSGPSYYVKIASISGRHRWILFCGGSGQYHLFDSENDAQEFLRPLTASGLNAG